MSQPTKVIVPDDFYDPITGMLMTNPVITPFGHSFDESALRQWHNINPICPITRNPFEIGRIRPNFALKNSIEQIKDALQEDQMYRKTYDIQCKPDLIEYITNSLNDIKPDCVTDGVNILVSVEAPVSKHRRPSNVVYIVDTSGSMRTTGTIKNEQGDTISTGQTILGIVKSAVKTVTRSLGPEDTIGIVSFNTTSEVKTTEDCIDTMFNVTPENIGKIDKSISDMSPSGTTNLWSGIETGLELLRKCSKPGDINYLIVLTDGQPTSQYEPPMGYIHALREYMEHNPEFNFIMETTGFGYSLNSELLDNLAKVTGGNFAFIPDSSLVCNIFAHIAAKIMSTAIIDATIKVDLVEGFSFTPIPCDPNNLATVSGRTAYIKVKNLSYGQKKHFLLTIDPGVGNIQSLPNPYANLSIDYQLFNGEKNSVTVNASKVDNDNIDIYIQQMRIELVKKITEAVSSIKWNGIETTHQIIRNLFKLFSNSRHIDNKNIQNMLKDIEGQLCEAFNMTIDAKDNDYYKRWGRHWIKSFIRAHETENSNNWKDPGVSNYTNELFIEYRDKVSEIFNELPPSDEPVRYNNGHPGLSSYTPPPPSSYNSSAGVCFHHKCRVMLHNGIYKACDDLEKGDKLWSDNLNGYTFLDCKLKTLCSEGEDNFVTLGKLRITGYHPIYKNDKWYFPIELGDIKRQQCNHVYSFLTSTGDNIMVEGSVCCALAHGKQGDKIGHSYLGTNKVREDLKKFEGYINGLVTITNDMVHRDKYNKRINAIKTS